MQDSGKKPDKYLRRSGREKPCEWPTASVYPGTLKGITQALKEAQMLAKAAGISQDVFAVYKGAGHVFIRRYGPDGEVALEGAGEET